MEMSLPDAESSAAESAALMSFDLSQPLRQVERSFLIGAILVSVVFGVMALLGFLETEPTAGGGRGAFDRALVLIHRFEYRSALLAVVIGLINLKSWVLFVGASSGAVGKGSNSPQRLKKQLLSVGFFALTKGLAVILLIILIKTAVPAKILSALVGFTLFLFFGSFALLLDGKNPQD